MDRLSAAHRFDVVMALVEQVRDPIHGGSGCQIRG
jgi:hypothetical protein